MYLLVLSLLSIVAKQEQRVRNFPSQRILTHIPAYSVRTHVYVLTKKSE